MSARLDNFYNRQYIQDTPQGYMKQQIQTGKAHGSPYISCKTCKK